MDLLKVLFSEEYIEFYEYKTQIDHKKNIVYSLSNESSKVLNQISNDLEYNTWSKLTDDDEKTENPFALVA